MRTRLLEELPAWVARLALVNLLWCAGTLAGLVVFGLFPATTAMASVLRRWVIDPASREQNAAATTRAFVAVMRAELGRSNAAGLLLSAVGVAMWLDLTWASAMPAPVDTVLSVAAAAGLLLVAVTAVNLPVVLAHLEASPLQALRTSALLGLARPMQTALLLALFVAWSFVLGRWPSVTPFFGASPLCLLAVWWALKSLPSAPSQPSQSTASRPDDEARDEPTGEALASPQHLQETR